MKQKYKKLRGLVIGCGSIGERHIHNLKKIGIKELGIFDINQKRLTELRNKYRVDSFLDIESALEYKPDFSIICTYPESHHEFAKKCINAKSHIFIEKPISEKLKEIEKVLNNAKSKKLKVAVGYNLRFDKGLRSLKKKILNNEIGNTLFISAYFGHHIKFWGNGKKTNDHYILQKGNGIILDDSHEYDYIRWLVNEKVISVFCQTKKLENIKTETESLASIFLKFKNGIIANVNIDYVRPRYERGCSIIGDEGKLEWKYEMLKPTKIKYGQKVESKLKKEMIFNQSHKSFNEKVLVNNMYIEEMKDFLDSLQNNKQPETNGKDGLETLKIGLAALKSAKNGKVIKI
jgi:predicted dehydrogenase